MRQKLGQHFLTDESVLNKIIETYRPSGGEVIVEVGPGKGVLTERLLKLGQKVLAIEWDETFVINLKQKYANIANIRIENADIRHFDLVNCLKGMGENEYAVVANLPYYLSSYFIRQLFEYQILPKSAVILVQKEVAERLVAKPGSKTRSTLSVLAQIYSTVKIELAVSPNAFTPPPKVESAIVSFENIKNPFKSKDQEKGFFRVVKAGFSSKRKTLLNSLSAGLRVDRSEVEKKLNDVGIDPKLRAEDLTNEEWLKLENEISKEN